MRSAEIFAILVNLKLLVLEQLAEPRVFLP